MLRNKIVCFYHHRHHHRLCLLCPTLMPKIMILHCLISFMNIMIMTKTGTMHTRISYITLSHPPLASLFSLNLSTSIVQDGLHVLYIIIILLIRLRLLHSFVSILKHCRPHSSPTNPTTSYSSPSNPHSYKPAPYIIIVIIQPHHTLPIFLVSWVVGEECVVGWMGKSMIGWRMSMEGFDDVEECDNGEDCVDWMGRV